MHVLLVGGLAHGKTHHVASHLDVLEMAEVPAPGQDCRNELYRRHEFQPYPSLRGFERVFISTAVQPEAYLELIDDALDKVWALGDYHQEGGCPNCGRSRLCITPSGMHRCEKCDWCPELNTYVPDQ